MSLVDFATLERPTSPNTYLLAPEGICRKATPDCSSPLWAISAPELHRAVKELIDSQGLWAIRDASEEPLQLSFVARTALLRFKDDVDVRVVPSADGAGSQLAIYSRSRLGYSDLGANAKRVNKILEMLPEPKKPG